MIRCLSGNRPFVERVGPYDIENLVRSNSSVSQTLKQLVPDFDFLLRDEHL